MLHHVVHRFWMLFEKDSEITINYRHDLVKSCQMTSGNATVPKKGRCNQMEAVNSHEQSTKAICPFRARPQLVRGTKGTTSESSNCPSFSDAIFWMKFLSQYIAMVWNELDQFFLARKIPVVKTCSPSHCKMWLHDYIKYMII